MIKTKKKYLLFITLLLVAIFLFLSKDSFFESSDYTSIDSKNYHNAFVGEQSCIKCHQNEFHEWKDSHHYMAMLLPNDSTVKGDFNNVTFTADGVTSRFFKKGNKFYINTEGDDGKNHDFEVKYTFGITPLQQYLVAFPDGRLQVPRLSWDTKLNKWFNQYAGQKIPSHDWLHWTGNSQNWNTMCASCHSTNLKKNYDVKTDSYKTTYSGINVSCESCHGPGKQHIDYINSDIYKEGEKKLGSYLTLHNKSSQTAQINTCTPCHARVTEISDRHVKSSELLDNYIPQIPDTEFFHADGQIDDEDYIYTSFLQSKMHAKGVKCTDCHNPHSSKLKRTGNLTCTSCHTPSKYDSPKHTFHQSGTKGAECISCHMPGRTYMGNDYRHDHSFRVPRPDLTEKYGTPNACNDCHKDKSAKSMSETIVKWYGPKRNYHFSDDLVPGSQLNPNSEKNLITLIDNPNTPPIVKATAAFYLGSFPTQKSLEALKKCLNNKDPHVRYRALRSLSIFAPSDWMFAVGPQLNDKVRAVRLAAADLFISIPFNQIPSEYQDSFNSAHKELRRYLRYQTDFSVGNILMADYYLKLQNYSQAEFFYLRGLKKDSEMQYALLNLSATYNAQGKNNKALEVLEKAKKKDPNNERIYYSLGLLYGELNDKVAAEKSFEKAVSLNSTNTRVYYNYGLILLESKKFKEAISVLEKGLKINPSAPELYYVLTFVYIQKNDQNKAKEMALILKKLDPNNLDYQQLFRNLGI